MAACLEALQPPPLWRTTMLAAWHRLAPAGKPATGAAKDQAEPAQLRWGGLISIVAGLALLWMVRSG